MTAAGKLLIFVPTYNERHNVSRLCSEVLALHLNADILFVDDNSPDGTGELLDQLASQHRSVKVVHRAGKSGIGTAHRAGLAYAYEHGYELLVTLDADFSHNPSDIPALLAALNPERDVIVGSRFLRRGSLPGWSPHRRLLTMLGHALTKLVLGIPYDASGAFRLYDLRRIPRELFELCTAPAYAFFYESLFMLHLHGSRIAEIPIVLPARVYGSSKLTLAEAFRSAKFLVRLWFGELIAPERYRVARPIAALRHLHDPQGWDGYWRAGDDVTGLVYRALAAVYRRRVIRPRLESTLARHFARDAQLLHAGCGSGQADVNLHREYKVTAIDISTEAVQRYARNNPDAERIEQASLFNLPFADATFDGVFNLGVMEHFAAGDLQALLRELRRVTKPGAQLVMFWPHRWSTSVVLLRIVAGLLRLIGRKARFHPPEVSLLRSRRAAADMMSQAGLRLADYSFGVRDFFVQCVVVATNPKEPAVCVGTSVPAGTRQR